MKGKFDAYVLWLLAKRVQNWIVDWSNARDFMVSKYNFNETLTPAVRLKREKMYVIVQD